MPKQCSLAVLFLTLFATASAQEKKDLTISGAYGWLGSSHYANNRQGNFLSIDFDYALAKRHILAIGFLSGGHRYTDTRFPPGTPNVSFREDGVNAKAEYNAFSVQYKYKFLAASRFSIAAGTGMGIMMHKREVPAPTATSSVTETLGGGPDLVFPVSLDADYHLSKQWKLGLTAGFYVEPDYPIQAWYIGPRLRFTIK